jgi:uncharacterized protein (TIGR00251 family)
VRLDVRVLPRASRNAVEGFRDGRLVIRVTAPPVDGAANVATVALLARTLDLAPRALRVVAGETSRNKTIEIDGVAETLVRSVLARRV